MCSFGVGGLGRVARGEGKKEGGDGIMPNRCRSIKSTYVRAFLSLNPTVFKVSLYCYLLVYGGF